MIKSTFDSNSIPPKFQKIIESASRIQQDPKSECFLQIFVKGVGWKLTSLRTGKQYTPDTYLATFGVYPILQHPEMLDNDDSIRCRVAILPKQKPANRRQGKGFGNHG